MAWNAFGRLATIAAGAFACAAGPAIAAAPPPPAVQKVILSSLPLPPTTPSHDVGACTAAVNPHGTGCMSAEFFALQAGSFLPDGQHVVARVRFAGAPAAPDPASIYSGDQLVVVKTNGTRFANGDAWKCLTCGMPGGFSAAEGGIHDYPQSFHDGRRLLAGTIIFDCGPYQIIDERCTPAAIKAYPIHWQATADDEGPGGRMRELRIHPDNEHLGFNAVAINDGRFDQFAYIGKLRFDPAGARYMLDQVNLLFRDGLANRTVQPDPTDATKLRINRDAIEIGEFRGFTADGREVVYVGYPWESSNIDIFAVDLVYGKVRRLTSHPEYVDPVDFSPDGRWMAIEDTRGTDRQMFLAAMRDIPPISDILTSSAVSSTRNNMDRRFFNLVLLDTLGDRGTYEGQILTGGPGVSGSSNDPNWNAMADPRFSPDSTALVYYQALVTTPSCGGANPLPCPVSTEPGGRHTRLMIARIPGHKATRPLKPFIVPDRINWAQAYVPGKSAPKRPLLPAGDYVLPGKRTGSAAVKIVQRADGKAIEAIWVNYTNFSDDGRTILNGGESVREARPDPHTTKILWKAGIAQTGTVAGRKFSSPDGFGLTIDVMVNKLEATGTLSTTISGKTYRQPANGM